MKSDEDSWTGQSQSLHDSVEPNSIALVPWLHSSFRSHGFWLASGVLEQSWVVIRPKFFADLYYYHAVPLCGWYSRFWNVLWPQKGSTLEIGGSVSDATGSLHGRRTFLFKGETPPLPPTGPPMHVAYLQQAKKSSGIVPCLMRTTSFSMGARKDSCRSVCAERSTAVYIPLRLSLNF